MIVVGPDEFTLVEYVPAELAEHAATALSAIEELSDDLDVEIRIDEHQATSRFSISSLDPVVFEVDSGAVEDYRDPRRVGAHEAVVTFTRLYLELLDRQSSTFGAPGLDAEVTQAHKIAWDVNLYGRVGRLGLRLHQPRFRYNFRNRHGFSDNADRVFNQLWAADDMTWARITELSDGATDPVVLDN